jgi:hypothetical protein
VRHLGGTYAVTVHGNVVGGLNNEGINVVVPTADSLAPTVSGNTVDESNNVAISVAASHLLPDRLTGNSGSGNKGDVLALVGHLEADLTLPRPGLPVAIGSPTSSMRTGSPWTQESR